MRECWLAKEDKDDDDGDEEEVICVFSIFYYQLSLMQI